MHQNLAVSCIPAKSVYNIGPWSSLARRAPAPRSPPSRSASPVQQTSGNGPGWPPRGRFLYKIGSLVDVTMKVFL